MSYKFQVGGTMPGRSAYFKVLMDNHEREKMDELIQSSFDNVLKDKKYKKEELKAIRTLYRRR